MACRQGDARQLAALTWIHCLVYRAEQDNTEVTQTDMRHNDGPRKVFVAVPSLARDGPMTTLAHVGFDVLLDAASTHRNQGDGSSCAH